MTKYHSDKFKKLHSIIDNISTGVEAKKIEVERNNTIRKLKEGQFFKIHESKVIYQFVPDVDPPLMGNAVYALADGPFGYKHYEGVGKILKNSLKVSSFIVGKEHSTIIQFQYLRFLD